MATPQGLSGSAFQVWVDALLSMHWTIYGGRYQRVPHHTNGDAGLEGVSAALDAYQVYADEETHSSAERSKKQKAKIRTDLRKLTKYRAFWATYLQGQRFRTWTLITPRCEDKSVIVFARTHANKLVASGLDILDAGFQAYVMTPEDFPEANARVNASLPQLPLVQPTVTPSAVSELFATRPDFVTKISDKVSRAQGTSETNPHSEEVQRLLQAHLRSEDLLAQIEKLTPEHWIQINGLLNERLQNVELGSALGAPQTSMTMMDLVAHIRAGLLRLGKLSEQDAGAIAHGTIAKWLGLCPLNPTRRPNV
jgi:hypothetical protein